MKISVRKSYMVCLFLIEPDEGAVHGNTGVGYILSSLSGRRDIDIVSHSSGIRLEIIGTRSVFIPSIYYSGYITLPLSLSTLI